MYTCEKCHKPTPTLYALKETPNEVKQWGCEPCWGAMLKTKAKQAVGKKQWNQLTGMLE